ncbi:MAG TPA: LysM peptidoglycan-binding domain-containing protein, partial [Pirellulales bacterium]
MERRKKLLLAVVVMAIGVAVALQFRKNEIIKSHSGSVENSDSGTATAGNGPAQVTPQVRPTSPDVTAFDGHIEAAPGSAAGGTSGAEHLAGVDEASGSNAARTGPLVDMNAPEQKHIIIDGDTLQSLAQHYLGRADRYWELFQYNRDVLRNPDVLPIGAELRIPSQVAIPPASGAAALPSAPTVPLSPLVPLPAMPNAPT